MMLRAIRPGAPHGHVDPSGEARRIERADITASFIAVREQPGNGEAHGEQGLLERAEPRVLLIHEPQPLCARYGLGPG